MPAELRDAMVPALTATPAPARATGSGDVPAATAAATRFGVAGRSAVGGGRDG